MHTLRRPAGSFFIASLMAFWVSAATAQTVEKPPDPVVASVNQHDIRLSYVYSKIESLALGDQVDVRDQLERFIDSVVQEEILFQSMLRSQFEAEPDLREQVKTAIVEYLIQKHVKDRLHISDDAIEQYYHDNASAIRGEHVQVRQILLSTRSECDVMLPQIDSEARFIELAKSHSQHPGSAANGGDLGRFMKHPGPLGFEEAWFDMKPGDMRIFDSADGCHIIRIVERETPPLPPLAEVKDRIRDLLQRNQEIALLRALIDHHAQDMPIVRSKLKPQPEK